MVRDQLDDSMHQLAGLQTAMIQKEAERDGVFSETMLQKEQVLQQVNDGYEAAYDMVGKILADKTAAIEGAIDDARAIQVLNASKVIAVGGASSPAKTSGGIATPAVSGDGDPAVAEPEPEPERLADGTIEDTVAVIRAKSGPLVMRKVQEDAVREFIRDTLKSAVGEITQLTSQFMLERLEEVDHQPGFAAPEGEYLESLQSIETKLTETKRDSVAANEIIRAS